MKVKKLIEILKEYPEDSEIICTDFYLNHDQDIFKICEKKLEFSEDIVVCLTPHPYSVEDIKTFEDLSEHNTYNEEDEFSLWSDKNGDLVTLKAGELQTVYKNLYKNYNKYEQECDYMSDFYDVGDLKRFLKHFKDDVKINITFYGNNGVIHKVNKRRVGYLSGTYDYIDEDYYDELFFEIGYELYGSHETLSLEQAIIPYRSEEILKCLARPIIDYFNNSNKRLSDEENKAWGKVLENQKDLLHYYYNINRRIDADHDSNGYYHLYDKDNPYMVFGNEYVEQRRTRRW